MRKLYLLSIALVCAYLFPQGLAAQDTCSASFTYTTNGNTAHFLSTPGLPPGTLHNWIFGDGSPGDGSANPVHTYAAPGTYWVKHYIFNQATNCNDSVIKEIRVPLTDCNIEPKFSFYRDSLDCRKIHFINLSTPISPNVRFIWKFGDGTTSNETNPTHIYPTDGNFNVCLVIEAGNNCRKESCQGVEIHCATPPCNLEVKFEWKKDSIDPLKISFINQTVVPAAGATYSWSFGDGSGSSERNPVHRYANAGTYTVCLKVMISNTCIKYVCKTIVVGPNCALQADFVWRKDSLQPNKVYFKSIVTSPAVNLQYQWKFGDGGGSYEANPTHVYTQPGVYKVCLIVTLSTTCKVEICKEIEIRVDCHLEPKFIWKIEEDNPRKVFFYNQTIVTSNNVKYEWRFGDGTYSHEKDPVHLYERAGEYEVCLTVKVGEDCKKTVCQKLVIRECDVRAKFESKRDGSQWNKVWFANLSHPVSNIWRTSWTYGDGTSSQDFNSFHVYPQPGKYVVCLKVQSLSGCISAYCDTVVVRRPDTCENRSEFRYEVAANNPLEYRFKPAHVKLTAKYYWDFGDGKSSTAVSPIHKFPHPGLYKVCLTVVTRNGCRTTTCKEVRVASRINCDSVRVKFEYTRSTQMPNQIKFQAIGSIPIVKQKWAIAKLGLPVTPPVVIEANNPTYTFRDTGWYVVCLYATTLGDCVKVYCERIHISRVGNAPDLTGSPVLVFPNPVSSLARIEFQMESAGPVNLRVLDAQGSVQLTISASGQAGNNSINVPVDRLGNGFYLVEIRYANRLKLAKFQKS